MNLTELAWAAGFFDGEGHVALQSSPLVSIHQTDRAVLDRFQVAVAVGLVAGPYAKGHWSPAWVYRTSNWRDSQVVLALLWKFLSAPKRAQFHDRFSRYLARPLPVRLSTQCGRGHDLSKPENIARSPSTPSGSRPCRECARIRQRGRVEKKVS